LPVQFHYELLLSGFGFSLRAISRRSRTERGSDRFSALCSALHKAEEQTHFANEMATSSVPHAAFYE
jgi:hypothetical protein